MTTTITNGSTSASPDLVLNYAYDRTARSIVHDVLDGRPDPDVTLRPVTTRAGTLALFCTTRATATAIEDLHLTPVVLTLTDTDEPTADISYVATGRLTVSWDAEYDKWRVDVDYREVAP